MDQQPKIPTLKDAQKPQVKIKGMGAGLTLFDRLKQFKKKDLAFILAGLGTLFMAPLAEHFMMAPENGDATLQKGWGGGSGGAGGIFGSGSSPYENGNNNIASGGAIGGAGDIITPLNVRDPSALVMGPGAAQQPNAGSAAPSAPPPTAPARSETDYKDALAGAASRAASAAVKRAPLPVPKIAVGGSGLRGLGVAGGGTSASGGLLPVGPAAGSTGGGGSSGLSLVRNAPGFRSAAGARSPTGGTGLDGTKKAGQNAGDAFSRTGSALSGLNAAASEQIPTGGQGYGGGGAGGSGANDKPYSGSGPGGSKSVGESLAFLEAKQRMEENLKLEFEKRKLKDPELLLYGIRNDSLKAMAAEMTKSLTKSVIGFMDPSSAANANAIISCPGGFQGMLSAAPMCSNDGKGGDAGGCVQKTNSSPPGYKWVMGQGTPVDCRVTGGKDDKPGSVAEQAPSTPGGPISGGWPTGPGRDAAAALDSFCTRLDTALAEIKKKDPTGANNEFKNLATMFTGSKGELAAIISGRDALYGTSASKACGATDTRSEGKSVYQYQAAITGSLTGDVQGKGGAIPDLAGLAGKPEGDVASAAKQVETARADLGKANKLIEEVEGSLAKAGTTNLGNAEFAKTQFKDEAPGAIKALKWLKGDGDPEGYIPKEKALLAKLEPVIQAGEFAATADPKNVPALIKLNKDYTTARDAAADLKAGESKPNTDVPAEQKAAAEAVKADIEKANPLVPKIKETYDAYVAKRDATEKKQDEIDAAKKTAQEALDAATVQWAQAQGKQVKILNDAQTVLQGIKTGK